MYPSTQRGRPHSASRSGHTSAPSLDTTASGIADSTISNPDSLWLSQFPQPPASIPSTPILSEFCSTSPSRSTFANRIPQRKKPIPAPANAGPSNDSYNVSLRRSHDSACSQSTTILIHPVSPYDWHDGASSIGMDTTEGALLPTSFITSLLRENPNKWQNLNVSTGSDVLNGCSEMTYPPPASSHSDSRTTSSAMRTLPQRPLPLSSFIPTPESRKRLSGELDTLHSTRDSHVSIVRTASVSRSLRLPGATIIGVAPATLHSISINQNTSQHYSDDSHSLKDDFPFEDVGPSVPTLRLPKKNPPTPHTRESIHSTKSTAPSFISRVSLPDSVRRVLAWRNAKPLPPVPLISHIPIAVDTEHRRVDETKTLPDLANRTDSIQSSPEKGCLRHQSFGSYYVAHKEGSFPSRLDDDKETRETTTSHGILRLNSTRQRLRNSINQLPKLLDGPLTQRNAMPKKRRLFVLLGTFLVIILATLGIAIGLTVGRRKATLGVCPHGLAGTSCNLNSTCVCTSPSSGKCNGLAQSIIDLIPSVNQYFSTNLTGNLVYDRIWLVQGAIPSNCAAQSILVDVAPVLRSQTFPNITHWAQSALLWNLVESQDLIATATLRKFVQKAPWTSLNIHNNPSLFSTTVSGHTFNFATQEVTQPDVSFMTVGQPTASQLSRVGPIAHSALDRMYSFARAASIQHKKALEIYWTTILQQQLVDLPTFVSAFSVSPILLPFDATLSHHPQSVTELLSTSTSKPFPPPLGCYPVLEPFQVQLVNAIEDGVFGLSPMSNASQFNPACYADRPIYGVLDVLRLRLPFFDSRSGIPRQAAILRRDVISRVLLHNGAILSPLPGPSNVTAVTTQLTDPRQYGISSHFNHVVLQYLSSIPDVNVAIALVGYILSSTSIRIPPPANTSILFKSLAMIPVIEVTVFGSVIPSDIDSVISSFATPSGTLFFGSNEGAALRNWTITGCGSSIAWAESALSPLIVRDSNFSDQIFNQTWTAVSIAQQNHIQNIGLNNVTESFNFNNKFSSS